MVYCAVNYADEQSRLNWHTLEATENLLDPASRFSVRQEFLGTLYEYAVQERKNCVVCKRPLVARPRRPTEKNDTLLLGPFLKNQKYKIDGLLSSAGIQCTILDRTNDIFVGCNVQCSRCLGIEEPVSLSADREQQSPLKEVRCHEQVVPYNYQVAGFPVEDRVPSLGDSAGSDEALSSPIGTARGSSVGPRTSEDSEVAHSLHRNQLYSMLETIVERIPSVATTVYGIPNMMMQFVKPVLNPEGIQSIGHILSAQCHTNGLQASSNHEKESEINNEAENAVVEETKAYRKEQLHEPIVEPMIQPPEENQVAEAEQTRFAQQVFVEETKVLQGESTEQAVLNHRRETEANIKRATVGKVEEFDVNEVSERMALELLEEQYRMDRERLRKKFHEKAQKKAAQGLTKTKEEEVDEIGTIELRQRLKSYVKNQRQNTGNFLSMFEKQQKDSTEPLENSSNGVVIEVITLSSDDEDEVTYSEMNINEQETVKEELELPFFNEEEIVETRVEFSAMEPSTSIEELNLEHAASKAPQEMDSPESPDDSLYSASEGDNEPENSSMDSGVGPDERELAEPEPDLLYSDMDHNEQVTETYDLNLETNLMCEAATEECSKPQNAVEDECYDVSRLPCSGMECTPPTPSSLTISCFNDAAEDLDVSPIPYGNLQPTSLVTPEERNEAQAPNEDENNCDVPFSGASVSSQSSEVNFEDENNSIEDPMEEGISEEHERALLGPSEEDLDTEPAPLSPIDTSEQLKEIPDSTSFETNPVDYEETVLNDSGDSGYVEETFTQEEDHDPVEETVVKKITKKGRKRRFVEELLPISTVPAAVSLRSKYSKDWSKLRQLYTVEALSKMLEKGWAGIRPEYLAIRAKIRKLAVGPALELRLAYPEFQCNRVELLDLSKLQEKDWTIGRTERARDMFAKKRVVEAHRNYESRLAAGCVYQVPPKLKRKRQAERIARIKDDRRRGAESPSSKRFCFSLQQRESQDAYDDDRADTCSVYSEKLGWPDRDDDDVTDASNEKQASMNHAAHISNIVAQIRALYTRTETILPKLRPLFNIENNIYQEIELEALVENEKTTDDPLETQEPETSGTSAVPEESMDENVHLKALVQAETLTEPGEDEAPMPEILAAPSEDSWSADMEPKTSVQAKNPAEPCEEEASGLEMLALPSEDRSSEEMEPQTSIQSENCTDVKEEVVVEEEASTSSRWPQLDPVMNEDSDDDGIVFLGEFRAGSGAIEQEDIAENVQQPEIEDVPESLIASVSQEPCREEVVEEYTTENGALNSPPSWIAMEEHTYSGETIEEVETEVVNEEALEEEDPTNAGPSFFAEVLEEEEGSVEDSSRSPQLSFDERVANFERQMKEQNRKEIEKVLQPDVEVITIDNEDYSEATGTSSVATTEVSEAIIHDNEKVREPECVAGPSNAAPQQLCSRLRNTSWYLKHQCDVKARYVPIRQEEVQVPRRAVSPLNRNTITLDDYRRKMIQRRFDAKTVGFEDTCRVCNNFQMKNVRSASEITNLARQHASQHLQQDKGRPAVKCLLCQSGFLDLVSGQRHIIEEHHGAPLDMVQDNLQSPKYNRFLFEMMAKCYGTYEPVVPEDPE